MRSFSVDFASHESELPPGRSYGSPDTPYIRDFVAHTQCDHEYVELESSELADSETARAIIRACDFPLGVSGDFFASLYRFFQAIRPGFAVALSGESADEIFGGYPWHHNRRTVHASAFPWADFVLVGMDVLAPELLERLAVDEFLADSYAQALADVPVLPGENPAERRMREISHMHLTRYVRFLLDRKDRLSMALGLEVRVPFCDHRLVEYAFNIPWRMQTFDGREKSVLRAAVKELLPPSIRNRKKSPYPSTPDPRYVRGLRAQVQVTMADPTHPAHPILHRPTIEAMLARPLDNGALADRVNLERAWSVSTWMKDYRLLVDA